MTTGSFVAAGPRRVHRAKPAVVVAALVAAVAMLALYSIRPIQVTGAQSSGDGFAVGYAAAVADFRAQTSALQTRGQQVSGGGTEQILPIYVELRAVTQAAATRFVKLHAPSAAKADYATFTALLKQQVQSLDSVVRDARAGSTRSLAADLQRYASLVGDWLTVRLRVEAAIH
jgi:hypothetical protein